MWAPWVAHWFHLRREHMPDVGLRDYLEMIDFARNGSGGS